MLFYYSLLDSNFRKALINKAIGFFLHKLLFQRTSYYESNFFENLIPGSFLKHYYIYILLFLLLSNLFNN